MRFKFSKLLCALVFSEVIMFSMTNASAVKPTICHKTDDTVNYYTSESFKCFKCGKWFDYRCLNALILTFGGKREPEDYTCWACSGHSDGMPYDELGFDKDGRHEITKRKWGPDGYDVNGFNKRGIHKTTGTRFNPQGFDQNGCDKAGKPVLKKDMYRFVGSLN